MKKQMIRRQTVTILFSALLIICVAGCARKGQSNAPSPRLVTLSPALTTIVFEMGLGDHVVGVTGFCQLPEGEQRPIVGNALNIRTEPSMQLSPR